MKTFTPYNDIISKNVSLKSRILFPLVFYFLATISIYLLEKWQPSGACTPGLGMLTLLFIFVPVSAGMALYNLKSAVKNKIYGIIAVLHLTCLLLVLKIFW